jgi:hypothetical protein
MKGLAESGQICSVGRRKIAKKIAKNKRCYATQLLTIKNRISSVIIGGWGGGGGGAPPSGITFGRVPPLPVTLRLTQGIMTPRLR